MRHIRRIWRRACRRQSELHRDSADRKACIFQRKGYAPERLADEARRDVGFGRIVGGHEQAYLRRRDISRVGWRILRQNLAGGCAGQRDGRGHAQLKSALSDDDGSGAVALADYLRDGDALRSDAHGKSHLPAAANHGACRWHLRDNFAFRDSLTVIFALDLGCESAVIRDVARLRGGFAENARHGYFAAVNGQAHGDER